MHITDLQSLRQLYAAPQERAVKKQITALDPHCRQFIALSPFAVMATSDAQQQMDASPRGGPLGFIKARVAARARRDWRGMLTRLCHHFPDTGFPRAVTPCQH